MGRETYVCQDCGYSGEFAYLSGSVRVEHNCRACGEMTVWELEGYDPTPDAPAAAETDITRDLGFRENDDGKLVLGGESDTEATSAGDD